MSNRRWVPGTAAALLVAAGAGQAQADLLRRTRHPALSPDGKVRA